MRSSGGRTAIGCGAGLVCEPLARSRAALDALAGQPVTLIAPSGTREAVALGLADDGALRVRLPDGQETRVHSGEVSVRRVAPR